VAPLGCTVTWALYTSDLRAFVSLANPSRVADCLALSIQVIASSTLHIHIPLSLLPFSFLSSFDLDLFKFDGIPEAENASFGWRSGCRISASVYVRWERRGETVQVIITWISVLFLNCSLSGRLLKVRALITDSLFNMTINSILISKSFPLFKWFARFIWLLLFFATQAPIKHYSNTRLKFPSVPSICSGCHVSNQPRIFENEAIKKVKQAEIQAIHSLPCVITL
jgi:hypothetical protein